MKTLQATEDVVETTVPAIEIELEDPVGVVKNTVGPTLETEFPNDGVTALGAELLEATDIEENIQPVSTDAVDVVKPVSVDVADEVSTAEDEVLTESVDSEEVHIQEDEVSTIPPSVDSGSDAPPQALLIGGKDKKERFDLGNNKQEGPDFGQLPNVVEFAVQPFAEKAEMGSSTDILSSDLTTEDKQLINSVFP